MKQPRSENTNSFIFDSSMKKYPQNDVRPSAIQFEKQISRYEQIHSFIVKNSPGKGSPHEKRFEKRIETPEVLSSTKRVLISDWEKYSPKKTLENHVKKPFYNCGDYNPLFE